MQARSENQDFFLSLLRQRFSAGLKGGLVAAIEQAFLDESCTHDSAPLTFVGGYIFEPSAAEEFQECWHKTLRPYASKGITYFHASACAANKEPFSNIGGAEKESLFYELTALTRRTARIGFVAEIENSVYQSWRQENPTVNSLVGSKYAACCLNSFLLLRECLKDEDKSKRIHYTFERIGEGEGKEHPFDKERNNLLGAIEASSRLSTVFRFGGYDKSKKGDMHALEAADLMVWTYSSIKAPLTRYTRISRKLFRPGGPRHRASPVTPTGLTFIAHLNDEHGIRENTYAGKIRIFKF